MAWGSLAQLGRIRIGAEPLNATTASRRVRKRVYPPPRARKLTRGSVCPRFGSNTNGKLDRGKLDRVDRIAACFAGEPGAAAPGPGLPGLAGWLALSPAIAHHAERSKTLLNLNP